MFHAVCILHAHFLSTDLQKWKIVLLHKRVRHVEKHRKRVTGSSWCCLLFFWLLPSNVIASKIRLRRRNVRWQCHHKCFALYLFYWIKIHLRLFSMNPSLSAEIACVLVLKLWNDLCFKHGWLKGHVIAVALSQFQTNYTSSLRKCAEMVATFCNTCQKVLVTVKNIHTPEHHHRWQKETWIRS